MKREETLSIMQPYAFPYFGYFCLIESSNEIVFYDDVNFIKRGWINRNNLLLNNKTFLFQIPLSAVSQNKMINEIEILNDEKWKNNLLKTINQCYSKAPFYSEVYPILSEFILSSKGKISNFAIGSINIVYDYLGLSFNYKLSSECSPKTKGQEKSSRLANITKQLGYKNYINVSSGSELYTKEDFKNMGVDLYFNIPKITSYEQFSKNNFVPYLSIIDILMFVPKNQIIQMIRNFEKI